MQFNSIGFAVFLPIVFALYWLLPFKYRWILLLTASCYFYISWNAKYILLILFTTVVSFFCARMMSHSEAAKNKKKILLGSALVVCLGILFIFKYFDFVSTSISKLFSFIAIPLSPLTLSLMLPLGISFYTFKTLSYLIDVYKGKIPAEKNIGVYAAYISFFPELLAGPIDRADNLLNQLKEKHEFSYGSAAYGLKQMAWGYFKKMVIADTLASYVNAVFDNVAACHGSSLLIASVFYSIQIYCDFSGYSDIAIGTAKLFNIKLMDNFRQPYFSASFKEFWSRWHISLSTWFRDYVYIPLGGNRCGKWRHRYNLMITFLASGLWHGANWTFIVWGGMHGFAQVIENLFEKKKDAPTRRQFGFKWLLRVALVFLFCTFAWIFFRANSFGDAFYVLKNMFVGISHPFSYIKAGWMNLNTGRAILIVLSFLVLTIFDYVSLKKDVIQSIGKRPAAVRWAVYIVFTLFVVLFSEKGSAAGFIYFQF